MPTVEIVKVEICIDCQLTAAGYSAEELGYTPEVEPMGLVLPNERLVPGAGEAFFGTRRCDTCGSYLAGDRFDAELVIA